MNMGRNKIIAVSISAVVVLGIVAGYFYWKSKQSPAPSQQSIIDAATLGVLPSIGTNPLTNKPDINPTSKTNPFTGVKTNPFQ